MVVSEEAHRGSGAKKNMESEETGGMESRWRKVKPKQDLGQLLAENKISP